MGVVWITTATLALKDSGKSLWPHRRWRDIPTHTYTQLINGAVAAVVPELRGTEMHWAMETVSTEYLRIKVSAEPWLLRASTAGGS